MSAGRLERDGYYEVPAGKIAAVVTSLEMHEPPAAEAPPAPEGVALVRVMAPDVDWYLSLFRAIGTPWLWFSRLRLGGNELSAILADPRIEVWAVRHRATDIGLVELDFRDSPHVELSFFGFRPEWTGRGLGRFAMAHAISRAFGNGGRRLWVHTCTLDHPAALRFYLRCGFRAFARSVEIADDPRLTGLLPRDAAPDVPLVDGVGR